MPGVIAKAPLTLLEAWLGTALNTVAGALFVVGSYTILAGMYRSFTPRQVLCGRQVLTLNFWGSASYLLVWLNLLPKIELSDAKQQCHGVQSALQYA
jgi:hypothetical protein